MKTIQRTYTAPQTTIHIISGTEPLMVSGFPNSILLDKDSTPGNQSQAEGRRWRNTLWDDDDDEEWWL